MNLDLAPSVLAWCALAMACGGLIKGVLGIGTPLLTVPMMAYVLPVHEAVVIMAIPVVVANLWQAYDAKRPIETVKRFWPAFTSLFAGTWFGVWILSGIEEKVLLTIVGLMVIFFTLIQGSKRKIFIPVRYERSAGAAFCGSAGLIGGLSSMFGPMMILYLVSLPTLEKDKFVNTISFLYVGAVVPWTILLLGMGMMNARLALLSGLAVIPLLIGLLLGRSIRKHVRDSVFYRLILGVLIVSGGSMIWRALL